jgi:hypothetical protein
MAVDGSEALNRLMADIPKDRLPPVDMWNPDFCGDIDMRIARDGAWYYMKTPIGRKPLVRLFSRVLRHDEDGRYYLVTPVEKLGITVDDAPFVAVELVATGEGRNQTLTFRTSVDDIVTADRDHPIRVSIDAATGEPSPYILVRDRLEALINRPVFYQMVDLGVVEKTGGSDLYGVWSRGEFFAIGPAEGLDGDEAGGRKTKQR